MAGRNMDSARRRNVSLRVFEAAQWKCQMPVCIADTRDLDLELRGVDSPWMPTIDHVVRLADGGSNNIANLRAAHRACNEHAGRQDERNSGYLIRERYPDLEWLVREIVRSD